MNASIKVFSKKGYDLATIDEIAKKAKVSKGIVFFYYKKKEHLIERAALRSVPVEEISAVNGRSHNNAKELLMDFGISFLKKYENPELRNLLLMTIANKERHKQIEIALRTMCFQEMNRMFLDSKNLQEQVYLLLSERHSSDPCYAMWYGGTTMK